MASMQDISPLYCFIIWKHPSFVFCWFWSLHKFIQTDNQTSNMEPPGVMLQSFAFCCFCMCCQTLQMPKWSGTISQPQQNVNDRPMNVSNDTHLFKKRKNPKETIQTVHIKTIKKNQPLITQWARGFLVLLVFSSSCLWRGTGGDQDARRCMKREIYLRLH